MTGHWLTIAKKDFQYARRSNVLLAIIGIFTIMTVGIVAVPGLFALVTEESLSEMADIPLFEITATAAGFIIPITALVGGYLAIAGERESGRIRLLLSMPPSRRDLVIGKFVSRGAVILLAIGIAYALAIVAGFAIYQDIAIETALRTVLLVGLLGITFVGIAVGISSFASTRARAIAYVLVFYMLVFVLWDPLVLASGYVLSEFVTGEVPEWLALVETVSPSSTFSVLYDETNGLLYNTLQESGATYPPGPVLLGLLIAWIGAALAVGYAVFERADLS